MEDNNFLTKKSFNSTTLGVLYTQKTNETTIQLAQDMVHYNNWPTAVTYN
jgi:hypothetical protein